MLAQARESPHTRSYFYVGGTYVRSPFNASEHIFVDQMYVEKLSPYPPAPPGHEKPAIILLHGSGQTGTVERSFRITILRQLLNLYQNFLNTPDGRPGWASHFLSRKYTVYITDQPHQGRSPVPPSAPLSFVSAELIEQIFTATKKSMMWPQAALHTQWPGTGLRGDRVFDRYYASVTALEVNGTLQQERMKRGLVALVEDIPGEVVVVAHSQAGFWAWTLADAVGRQKVRGVVALEPPGPPFEDKIINWSPPPVRVWGLTDLPLTYDPPIKDPIELKVAVSGTESKERSACLLQTGGNVRKLKIRDVPVLVVTAEASFHAVYDHCTVEYLRQAGVAVDFVRLEEKGIRGNGHMFFLEKNSKDIWKVVQGWIEGLI